MTEVQTLEKPVMQVDWTVICTDTDKRVATTGYSKYCVCGLYHNPDGQPKSPLPTKIDPDQMQLDD
jgi:hypothetical protein